MNKLKSLVARTNRAIESQGSVRDLVGVWEQFSEDPGIDSSTQLVARKIAILCSKFERLSILFSRVPFTNGERGPRNPLSVDLQTQIEDVQEDLKLMLRKVTGSGNFLREIYRQIVRESQDPDNEIWLVGEEDVGEFQHEENVQLEDPWIFARRNGVRIMNNHELDAVVIDSESHSVLGVLFVAPPWTDFSFDVAVERDYRNRGLGSRLVDRALEILKHMDFADSDTSIDVEVISDEMRALLTKRGFEVTDTRGKTVYMSPKGSRSDD